MELEVFQPLYRFSYKRGIWMTEQRMVSIAQPQSNFRNERAISMENGLDMMVTVVCVCVRMVWECLMWYGEDKFNWKNTLSYLKLLHFDRHPSSVHAFHHGRNCCSYNSIESTRILFCRWTLLDLKYSPLKTLISCMFLFHSRRFALNGLSLLHTPGRIDLNVNWVLEVNFVDFCDRFCYYDMWCLNIRLEGTKLKNIKFSL